MEAAAISASSGLLAAIRCVSERDVMAHDGSGVVGLRCRRGVQPIDRVAASDRTIARVGVRVSASLEVQ